MPYSVYLPTFQGVWYVLLHKFREQKDFEGGTLQVKFIFGKNLGKIKIWQNLG